MPTNPANSPPPQAGEAGAQRGEAERSRAESPKSVEEALARAREHGRAAAAESLSMLRALLDAGALVASGEPSQAHRLLGPLAGLLQDLSTRLDRDPEAAAAPILSAITEALDAEIARWEQRAADDPEARAVLRAFLGLRELLWEFGVRRSPAEPQPHEAPEAARPEPRVRRSRQPRRTARVQRVSVEG